MSSVCSGGVLSDTYQCYLSLPLSQVYLLRQFSNIIKLSTKYCVNSIQKCKSLYHLPDEKALTLGEKNKREKLESKVFYLRAVFKYLIERGRGETQFCQLLEQNYTSITNTHSMTISISERNNTVLELTQIYKK